MTHLDSTTVMSILFFLSCYSSRIGKHLLDSSMNFFCHILNGLRWIVSTATQGGTGVEEVAEIEEEREREREKRREEGAEGAEGRGG